MRPAPLLDLLGGGWSLGVPVVAAAWDEDLAGFALGDGSLALTRAEWAGGPALAPRPGGGLELRPGEPPPPLARQAMRGGACLALRAAPGHGFLSGDSGAGLARVAADLSAEILTGPAGGRAEHFAIAPDGRRHATALGRRVEISGETSAILDAPSPVTALLFDPSGGRLAVADAEGVTLWSTVAPPLRLPTATATSALVWAPDGGRIACGLENATVLAWNPGTDTRVTLAGAEDMPRSLSFAPDGRRLVASGGARMLCWSLEPPIATPMACGLLARVPISIVAWHPGRDLIAVGTRNGAVTISPPFGHDALHIRGEGGGAVTVLAWSPDGVRLAIGTEGGDLGVLPLPESLFRPSSEETLQ